jgi:hypothetical protein
MVIRSLRSLGLAQSGFPQVLDVVELEEAGPGGEVGGDDPAAVDLPGLRRQAAQAHGLRGPDLVGLDDGVLTVHHVDVLGGVAAGDALDAAVRDGRAEDGGTPEVSEPLVRPARPASGTARWPVGAASHRRGQLKAVHGSGVAG